jgi:hypothetical protein
VKKQVNNLHFCQNCNTFHSKTTSCSLVLSECLSPKDPSAGKIKPYTGRTCRSHGKVSRVVGSSQGRTCMLLIRYGLHGCNEQFSSWKVKPCKISLAITYSLSSLNQNCQATTLWRGGSRMLQKGSVLPWWGPLVLTGGSGMPIWT